MADSIRDMLLTTPKIKKAPPAVDYAVHADGLSKRYGDIAAVNGIDLRVRAGRVTGFIGPNGAGKTTTIRMLLGLVQPTSGTGVVLGEPIDGDHRYLSRVGALIDGPAFVGTLSGRDNLELLARLSGHADRIPSVLAQVGLMGRERERVRGYSLGMRQRLGIAAALLPDPQLLILDEPTNGLDPAGIREVRALLRRLADEGRTVFVSSHLLSELETICDDVIVVKAGQVVYTGDMRDLLARQRPEVRLTARRGDLDRLHALLDADGWNFSAPPDDDTIVVEAAPDAARELNALAHDGGVVLREVHVVHTDLETTFFALTGTDSNLEA